MNNMQPSSVSLNNTAIAARAGGSLIGTLSGIDPQGDALTYSVTDTRFVVVGDKLYTTALFDLSNAPPPSLDLAITATDPGGLFLTTNFNLTVAPSALMRDVVLGGAPAGTGNLSMVPASFPNVDGSTLADSVSYAVQAVGAAGVQGGQGSEGGAGGVGGDGLAVAGLIDGLGFDLRQAGSDTLTLLAKAQGGQGGQGGEGGDGSWGRDGQDGDVFYDFDLQEWDVLSYPEPGGDGGDGGRGGDGGNGGRATASILNTTISLGHGAVTLKAEAIGGNAGEGGRGGFGGLGGMGGFGGGPIDDAPSGLDGNSGDDGSGGDSGGNAGAAVNHNAITATGALDLRLEAIAIAGAGYVFDGEASAIIAFNTVQGALLSSGFSDSVAISMSLGGPTFAARSGAITDNAIDLGAGNDLLSLSLLTDGAFRIEANVFTGGTGTDRFDVSGVGDRDVLIDFRNGKFSMPGALVNTLGGFEVAIGGAGDDTLLGGDGNETLQGMDGADTLHGSGGDDLLSGQGGRDLLIGGEGGDTLDGGLGADTMRGENGNDRYIVDDAGDRVIETTGAGTDLVQSSVTFSLAGQHIENLTLTGAAAINGTGNSFANNILGNGAANAIDGGLGADTLDGGAGADTMRGETDDDIYVVDNAGDRVIETSGAGTDLVLASVTFTLAGQHIENLTLTGAAAINGTGNSFANNILGNGAANAIDGGLGADTMRGGAGNDTYTVDNAGDRVFETSGAGTDLVLSSVTFSLAGQHIENLTLTGAAAINGTGNSFANNILGNGAANVIDGGLGADTMRGEAGDDIYLVDNAGDRVIETSGAGTDLVQSSVSFSLAGQNIENLTLTGAAAINGIGNTLDNLLTGNGAANVIDGGQGADTMRGGAGNDTYMVDNAGDRVFETSGAGTDIVLSSVSFSLAEQNIENLTLTGAAISGIGNILDNLLTGNGSANLLDGDGGADTLSGGLGNDTLTGWAGADRFVFGTAAGATNIDRITDFTAVDDTIVLSAAVFGGLGVGALTGAAFVTGVAAANGASRIIYNSATGALFHDADGTGLAGAVQFATLSPGLGLTAADFLIV